MTTTAGPGRSPSSGPAVAGGSGTGGARQRTPVMADVARLAGVSHQTVSRVLNHHPNVTPETRDRVQRAVAQLGYRRNRAARALVTRRTGTIGVVSVYAAYYGPAKTLFGVEEAARAADHAVVFVAVEQVDRATMRAALDHLVEAEVDGIVVIAPTPAAVAAVAALAPEVPLVVTQALASDLPSVLIDQARGARLATAHLLDLGHRTVHHVRGPETWFEADARARGWAEELGRRGAVVAPALGGDWSAESGYRAGQRLAADAGVTAVFAANDPMALGILRALHEAGRAVPGEVSVVGFDDIPEAGYVVPPLTTVHQDFAEVGRRCLQLLTDLLAGGGARPVVVEPALVARASTAPPPAG